MGRLKFPSSSFSRVPFTRRAKHRERINAKRPLKCVHSVTFLARRIIRVASFAPHAQGLHGPGTGLRARQYLSSNVRPTIPSAPRVFHFARCLRRQSGVRLRVALFRLRSQLSGQTTEQERAGGSLETGTISNGYANPLRGRSVFRYFWRTLGTRYRFLNNFG